jgi:hypothetical protein
MLAAVPTYSRTIAGFAVAAAITGCGSGGDGEVQRQASTARAPTAPAVTTQTAPTATATATAPAPSATPTAPAETPAAPAVPPATGHPETRLAKVCRSARRRHPWPARPSDPAAFKTYAAAALPAARATFERLRRVREPGGRASGLVTGYGGLTSLYQQLSRGPASRARQIGPALVTVERLVGGQARSARAPACAPPGS